MFTKQQMAEAAMKMVIMDAIEKGATQQEVIEFMKTEECRKAADSYMKMFEEKFGKKEEEKEQEQEQEQEYFPKLKKTYTRRQCVAIKPDDLIL